MSARNLPSYFLEFALESITDYDFVEIADQKYLLPTSSMSVTCQRGIPLCLRNETVFQHYDKFTANSSITFDGGGK